MAEFVRHHVCAHVMPTTGGSRHQRVAGDLEDPAIVPDVGGRETRSDREPEDCERMRTASRAAIAVSAGLRVEDDDATIHDAVIVPAVRLSVAAIVVIKPEVDIAVDQADCILDVLLQSALLAWARPVVRIRR